LGDPQVRKSSYDNSLLAVINKIYSGLLEVVLEKVEDEKLEDE